MALLFSFVSLAYIMVVDLVTTIFSGPESVTSMLYCTFEQKACSVMALFGIAEVRTLRYLSYHEY